MVWWPAFAFVELNPFNNGHFHGDNKRPPVGVVHYRIARNRYYTFRKLIRPLQPIKSSSIAAGKVEVARYRFCKKKALRLNSQGHTSPLLPHGRLLHDNFPQLQASLSAGRYRGRITTDRKENRKKKTEPNLPTLKSLPQINEWQMRIQNSNR